MIEELLRRIDTEPLLGVLVASIAVLAALATGSLLWLMWRSVWQGHITRLRDRFWRGLGRDLVEAFDDPVAEARWLDEAASHRPEVLRHCLNEYMIRTSGDYREGLARLYRRLGLLQLDLRALGSWRWRTRMYALRRLAGVVQREHREAILRLADEGGEVRLLVAQIIGRIGTADDVFQLLSDWRVTSRLTEYPVHVMVGTMPPDEMRQLLTRWDELRSVEVQRVVLSAAAKRVPAACWGLLPEAARHPSLEVRIAACRAAARMTSAVTLDLLIELAGDEAWEVRAQAVKAMAAHRGRRAQGVLCRALTDRNFWVRQNAAGSLGQHGDSGVRRLREVVAHSDDRYARDAATYVLMDLDLIDDDAQDDAKAA